VDLDRDLHHLDHLLLTFGYEFVDEVEWVLSEK
jgi:hypothetical protein